ncbi:MAG: hypothetical protein ACX93O_14770 [Flagellimonas sp.]
MRPTLTITLMVLLLYGCGPMLQMQSTKSQVPIIGSIGKHRSLLFKKNFQKIGEPDLGQPINIAFEAIPFSRGKKVKYVKYLEGKGLPVPKVEKDTTKRGGKKYYRLRITDVVQLVEELNGEENSSLKQYLQKDVDLTLLSTISFVTGEELSTILDQAEKLYLMSDRTGALTLIIGDVHKGHPIKLSTLEIFDFGTAGFCWQKDKRGQLNIAHVLMDGGTCPGTTSANPQKLNKTPDYLKL